MSLCFSEICAAALQKLPRRRAEWPIAGAGSDCTSHTVKCALELQHTLRSQGSVIHLCCAQQRDFDLLFSLLF